MSSSLDFVKAYAAPGPGQRLVPTTIRRREVGANDVLIKIEYAGICHSDIHTGNGEWDPRAYPLTPGHEIFGHVAAAGSDVTTCQVGDRAGVGCMVNACGECVSGLRGEEQFCLKGAVFTYGSSDHDGTITGRILHAYRRRR